jgi:hypothetical protein
MAGIGAAVSFTAAGGQSDGDAAISEDPSFSAIKGHTQPPPSASDAR